MPDCPFLDVDARGVLDVERPRVLFTEVREVVRVRGVVTADDQHDVGRVLHHLSDRVLTLLRRRANRSERAKMCGGVLLTETLDHRFVDLPADRERLVGKHRGLVGHADEVEIDVWVETV